MMPRLTKRNVDAAKPAERDYFVWDEGLPGFGLRVFPSGRKSYLIQYRIGRRTRRYTIGLHGKFTPEEARARARKLLHKVSEGGDPASEKAEERDALTVGELAELYLREGPAAKPTKKASSWKTDESNIRRHILPLLGQRVAKDLTPTEVQKFQAAVAAGRSAADEKTRKRGRAIVRGGRGTAARSLAVLAALLEFGAQRGLLPVNPAKGVRPFRGETRERFLTEREVAALGRGLAMLEAMGVVAPVFGAALRLLLLTGARKNEIARLQWDQVELDRGLLRLPDSKTGAKVVPLPAAAQEILADLPRRSRWVFPSPRDPETPIVGLQKVWETVRYFCGLEGVRIHDLRHSFASFAAADGGSLYLIGKVLGHRQARTTERYAHLSDDPLKMVADRAAGRIANALAAPAATNDAD